MVQVKGRVAGRAEDVVRRVSAHGVVPAAVHANVACAGDALHLHLEVVHGLRLDDVVVDGGGVGKRLEDVVVEIAAQAARVIGEAVAITDGDVSWSVAVYNEEGLLLGIGAPFGHTIHMREGISTHSATGPK